VQQSPFFTPKYNINFRLVKKQHYQQQAHRDDIAQIELKTGLGFPVPFF
jgi:hypothetical protein